MFKHAVRDRLLQTSPFSDIKGGSEANSERQHFIDLPAAEQVLAACPDEELKLVFALARFGGLRCPSEVVALKWSDIDWKNDRFRIARAKTPTRYCPLFPEIRLALQAARKVAAKDATFCLEKHRGSSAYFRTKFMRILLGADLPVWPKLFNNLRSTRRTELQEKFPDHVVNRWLGHGRKVAEKHYLQITEEHWSKASDFRSLTGSLKSTQHGAAAGSTETKKPSKLLGLVLMKKLVLPYLMTPTGVEPVLPP